jgi:MraZ protein
MAPVGADVSASGGKVACRVALWGEVGYGRGQRAGVEGLLPLLHFGSSSTRIATLVSFRGTFEHTLDAKNRLTVPAKYRSALAEGALLAMPLDQMPCVTIWLPEEYDSYTQDAIKELPPLSPGRSELERFFFGNSQHVDLDGAGRIMLPSFLIDHAKLAKDVVVVGAGKRLELWSKAGWGGHQPTLLERVADITAHVDDA